MGSAYQFHSWRVFVVVCALPCVSAVVALTFMPESPRFYLEVREKRRIAAPFSVLMTLEMTLKGFQRTAARPRFPSGFYVQICEVWGSEGETRGIHAFTSISPVNWLF